LLEYKKKVYRKGDKNLSNVKLTKSYEDYLESIYITNENKGVKITDLANKKSVAKSSVHQAVTRLKEMGLVTHEKYGRVYLTTTGLETAQKIVNTHDVLKRFLIDVLNVNPKVANKDACSMEHVISRETLEKLVKYMNSEYNYKGKNCNNNT
jgi:DtxR family Mn-dependent transcriptional regulator